MKVAWLRSLGGGISFRHPYAYLSFGIRGSGKSSLLEHIAENFLANGSGVLDLFGSRDGEGLAWGRSKWADTKKILLLHGDNTSVASSFDSKNVGRFSFEDLENYDIIISSGPLYSSLDQEYRDVNKVVDMIYKNPRVSYKRLSFCLIREAANLLYSRLKIGEDQVRAKSMMTYLVRESRHHGFALGIDTQRYMSVDIDIRSSCDYIFFKSLGIPGLPDDLHFIYAKIKPLALQRMRTNEFVVLTSSGSLGIGIFPEVPFHKKPGEDIMKLCGIEVEHSDEMTESVQRSRAGDLDHARFIEDRLQGGTLKQIARGQWSPATVFAHISYHNSAVQKFGACDRCTRAKSTNDTTRVPKDVVTQK